MEVDKYQNQIDSLKHEVEKVKKDAYEKAIESATKSIQNVNTLLTFLGILVAILGVLGFYGYFKTEKMREVVEKGLKEVDELKTKITRECDKAVQLRSQMETVSKDTKKKAAEIDRMYLKIEKILEKAETVDRGIDKKKIAVEEAARRGETLGYLFGGNSHLNNKRFVAAIENYKRVIELDPENLDAYNNGGVALYKLAYLKKDEALYRESIEKFDRAIGINPKDADVWYNKACAFSSWVKKKEALDNLKNAIELDVKCKEDAKKDEDFNWLREDPDFKRLVE